MKKELWISNKIVHYWPVFLSGYTTLNTSKVARSYAIWERANFLISNSNNDFDLSDAVLNLKRSLDQRLKLVETIYKFKSKNIVNKPKHYLDLLAHLGIIRPLLFHKLLKIRNAIEHEDKKPPNKIECLELADIIWYFLKSTDSLVSMEKSGFMADGIQKKYGFDIEINWKQDKIEISGWFPKKFISDLPQKDFYKVLVKKLHKKVDFKQNKEMLKYHKNKSGDDIWLTGYIVLSPTESLQFYKKLFSLYN